MTRIFDALRKSGAAREPAPMPAPAVIHPVRPSAASAARPALERIEILGLGPIAPFDENVRREMTGLRVSLDSLLPARNPRSVMLISAKAGEGTSTVALQFAQSLAMDAHLRVLVVDANLRRESPLLERARANPGGVPPGAALDLLPLGDRLRRSGALPIASIRDLIEVSGAGYDWLIVDGPPLLESPESAPLAAQLDGAVLVIQAGRIKRPMLTRAVDLLRRSQANVLGTVLNRRRLEIPDFLYRRI